MPRFIFADAVPVHGGTALLDSSRVVKWLGPQGGHHVADFGCGGNGHFVIPLAKIVGEKGIVYAVDVRTSVLEVLKMRLMRERLYQVETKLANLEDAGSTGIPNADCDAVLIVNVLFQNIMPEHILAEAHRVLKPGGTALVIDWKPEHAAFGPPRERRIAQERVVALAQGFTKKESFSAGPAHYALVLEKN